MAAPGEREVGDRPSAPTTYWDNLLEDLRDPEFLRS
jgi:hypothetical protein